MARGCAALIRNSPPKAPVFKKSDNRDAIRFVNFDNVTAAEGRVKHLPDGVGQVTVPAVGKSKTRPSANSRALVDAVEQETSSHPPANGQAGGGSQLTTYRRHGVCYVQQLPPIGRRNQHRWRGGQTAVSVRRCML